MLKRRFVLCLLALALLLCGGARAEMTEELIRLHVVAGDNTPEAQSLKLEIRDACLKCADACLADAENADAAYIRLRENLPAFQAAAEARAQELGSDCEIYVEAGRFDFPDRLYGSTLVPAGRYRALRVVIDGGAGHNWWCVLYPSLCVLDEQDYASGELRVYSALLKWLRERFEGGRV